MKWLGDVVMPSVDEQMRARYIKEGYDKYFEYELRIIQNEKDKELINELVYLKEEKEILSINYSKVSVSGELLEKDYKKYLKNKDKYQPKEEIIVSNTGVFVVYRIVFNFEYLDPKYKKFIKPCSYIRGNKVKENKIYELDIYKEKYSIEEESFRVYQFAVINEIKIKDKKIFLEDEELIRCFFMNFITIADAAIINEKAEVFKDEEIKERLIKEYKFDMKIRDKEEVYYRWCSPQLYIW